MEPSRVREAILEQHADLRERLAELRALAASATGSDEQAAIALRESGLQVLAILGSHLDFEDRYLVPALREVDAWGDERADLVTREHAEQREIFHYILERLRETQRPSVLLAREVETLVDAILVDMGEEERTMLDEDLLRDDVVGINVEAG
jgi:hypothetical protein